MQHQEERALDFQILAETIGAAIWVYQGAKVRYVSPEAERLSGYTRDELLDMNFWDIVHPEYADLIHQRGFARQRYEPVPSRYELKFLTKSGEERWMELSASVIEYEGHPAGLGTGFDITDRKRAEEQVRRSEARHRALLGALPDLIFRFSAEGEFLDFQANSGAPPVWAPPEEFLGRNLAEVMPEDVARQAREAIRRALSSGQVQEFDYELEMPGGRRAYEARLGAAGSKEVIAIVRDVTEHKRGDEALRQSEAFCKKILTSTHSGILIFRKCDGAATFVNPRFTELTGLSMEDLRVFGPDGYGGMVHPEDRDEWAVHARAVSTLADGESRQIEYRFCREDGDGRWLLSRDSVFSRHENGDAEQIMAMFVDVTEQKKAEEALRESEARYRLVTEAAPHETWIMLPDGTVSFVTKGLTGLCGEDALHSDWLNAVHPEDRERVRDEIASQLRAGEAHEVEFRLLQSSGGSRWSLIRAVPLRDEKGRITQWVGTTSDIHERKRAEEELRINEERFRTLVESIPAIIWTAGPDGRIDYHNHRWIEYTHQTAEEAQSAGWGALIHPDDLPQCVERWVDAITHGEEFHAEVRLRRHDGEWRWLVARAIPLRTPTGEIVKWFGSYIDIDDQKRSAEALREANLILARTNEGLEQFAWAASHDLQEPLRMVTGFTELLERRYAGKLDEDGRLAIHYAVDGARRMAALLRGLREYWHASEQPDALTEVDAGLALQEALEDLRASIVEAGAKISTGPMPVVRADMSALARVFQNLISNALKYRHAERHAEVEISAAKEGDEWVFSVRDNGIGIPAAYQQQIFGVFKRLHRHEEYEGTGIGLALCKRIAERYNGRLWVESEPGIGSRFCFSLPG